MQDFFLSIAEYREIFIFMPQTLHFEAQCRISVLLALPSTIKEKFRTTLFETCWKSVGLWTVNFIYFIDFLLILVLNWLDQELKYMYLSSWLDLLSIVQSLLSIVQDLKILSTFLLQCKQ